MSALVPSKQPGLLDLVDIAGHLASQPELFDRHQLPIESDTVTAARVFACSGRTICNSKHEARALTIAALRLAGVGKKEICRQLSCHSSTVDAVMIELERQGKIETAKDRLPRLLANTALEAGEWAREIIEERKISSDRAAMVRALGVVAGIGSDKAAAVAPAGDLHLHQHVHLEGADPMKDYLKQRAAALATDSNSAGGTAKPLMESATAQWAAALAACCPAEIGVEAVPAEPSVSTPGEPPTGTGTGAGGGSAQPAGAGTPI